MNLALWECKASKAEFLPLRCFHSGGKSWTLTQLIKHMATKQRTGGSQERGQFICW